MSQKLSPRDLFHSTNIKRTIYKLWRHYCRQKVSFTRHTWNDQRVKVQTKVMVQVLWRALKEVYYRRVEIWLYWNTNWVIWAIWFANKVCDSFNWWRKTSRRSGFIRQKSLIRDWAKMCSSTIVFALWRDELNQ